MEDSVLSEIKESLKTHKNCFGVRVTNITGMPDMIACVNGRFLGIEVKWEKEGAYQLTLAQKIRLRKIIRAGGLGCCVDKNNVGDFKKLIETLCNNPFEVNGAWGWEG